MVGSTDILLISVSHNYRVLCASNPSLIIKGTQRYSLVLQSSNSIRNQHRMIQAPVMYSGLVSKQSMI